MKVRLIFLSSVKSRADLSVFCMREDVTHQRSFFDSKNAYTKGFLI